MKEQKSVSLDLQLAVVEARPKPGCNTSTTSPLCTCPILS